MGLSLRNSMGRWAGFLTLALSLAAAGCGGGSKANVSGKVYYKDAPLKGGKVTFVDSNKQSYLAEIKEDGSYTIEKIPPGEVKISVETNSLKPPNPFVLKNKPPVAAEGGYKPPDYEARAKRYVPIPQQYADPEQSHLTYTVKGGKQEYDIKLTN